MKHTPFSLLAALLLAIALISCTHPSQMDESNFDSYRWDSLLDGQPRFASPEAYQTANKLLAATNLLDYFTTIYHYAEQHNIVLNEYSDDEFAHMVLDSVLAQILLYDGHSDECFRLYNHEYQHVFYCLESYELMASDEWINATEQTAWEDYAAAMEDVIDSLLYPPYFQPVVMRIEWATWRTRIDENRMLMLRDLFYPDRTAPYVPATVEQADSILSGLIAEHHSNTYEPLDDDIEKYATPANRIATLCRLNDAWHRYLDVRSQLALSMQGAYRERTEQATAHMVALHAEMLRQIRLNSPWHDGDYSADNDMAFPCSKEPMVEVE